MTSKRYEQARAYIAGRTPSADIAIVLGSGLGDYADDLTDDIAIPYAEIPGFPVSTVAGHKGLWHNGLLHGKRVIMMQGRFHAYEGYGMDEVTFPIRVMKLLGVKTLILTNAAGGVNLNFKPGELMLITDFINLSGKNPLFGPNNDAFGPRFPDMTCAYDRELQALCLEAARAGGVKLQKGVYCWMNGPCYESPAEIRMVRTLGADAVGMSTVPETIVARHCGLRVIGVSCITNMAAGILDQPLDHHEVMETGLRAGRDFKALLDQTIQRL